MKNDTPMRAIRLKCLDCTLGQTVEIRECRVQSCALFPYRMGHRPAKDKEMYPEEDSFPKS